MNIKDFDIKKIRIRRKPRFIDCLRVFLGIFIIGFGIFCGLGYIPDTKPSAPVCLVIFGLLFMLWGFYPMCSKNPPSSSRVLEVMDKLTEYPEAPGQLRKVRIPGTNIVAGYTKEELAKMEADRNAKASPETETISTEAEAETKE